MGSPTPPDPLWGLPMGSPHGVLHDPKPFMGSLWSSHYPQPLYRVPLAPRPFMGSLWGPPRPQPLFGAPRAPEPFWGREKSPKTPPNPPCPYPTWRRPCRLRPAPPRRLRAHARCAARTKMAPPAQNGGARFQNGGGGIGRGARPPTQRRLPASKMAAPPPHFLVTARGCHGDGSRLRLQGPVQAPNPKTRPRDRPQIMAQTPNSDTKP